MTFREPRVHDEAFLKRLRQIPCVVPRCTSQRSEAAHIGVTDYGRGVRESGHAKPHDFLALPCCSIHHRESGGAEHVVGAERFWQALGVEPLALAAKLYAAHQKHADDITALAKMRLIVLEARFAADD